MKNKLFDIPAALFELTGSPAYFVSDIIAVYIGLKPAMCGTVASDDSTNFYKTCIDNKLHVEFSDYKFFIEPFSNKKTVIEAPT